MKMYILEIDLESAIDIKLILQNMIDFIDDVDSNEHPTVINLRRQAEKSIEKLQSIGA